jgi:transposase InsO family protein
MKQDYPGVSKKKLCALFGKSRHALYDHQYRQQQEVLTDDIVLQYVHQIRGQLPRLGTRKLHHKLQPLLAPHGIQIGRDYLFDLLQDHKLLVRQRKRKAFTTNSRHWMRKYANLVKDMVCSRPEQLWVSDMTFMRLGNQWVYLSLITDAYSRQIMGYCLRTDMTTEGCMEALQMALRNRLYPQQPLIHHSDRGSQYCSSQYVKLLTDNSIAISMTQNGDPYENALAERINGILKGEFDLYSSQQTFTQAEAHIAASIHAYNHERPHSSCDFLTPVQAHLQQGQLKKRWKKYPYKPVANKEDSSKKEVGTAPFTEQGPGSFLRPINQIPIFDP